MSRQFHPILFNSSTIFDEECKFSAQLHGKYWLYIMILMKVTDYAFRPFFPLTQMLLARTLTTTQLAIVDLVSGTQVPCCPARRATKIHHAVRYDEKCDSVRPLSHYV
jgi:hypothetical protein